MEDNVNYDSINDPKQCYLLSYNDTNAWGNSFKEGYRRGKIQKGYSSMMYGANGMGGAVILKTAKPKKAFEGYFQTPIILKNGFLLEKIIFFIDKSNYFYII